MTRFRRIAAPAIAVVTAAMYVASMYMGFRAQLGDLIEGVTWGGAALSLTVIGAVISSKQPDNRIGWLMALYGFFESLAGFAELYGEFSASKLGVALPLAAGVSWVLGISWAFSAGILLVFLPLTLPTGHALSPRWRWVGWLAVVGAALLTVSTVFVALARPELMPLPWEEIEAATVDVSWVFTLSDLGFPIYMIAGALAFLSLIIRFVRSRGVERQQMKLLAYAVALTLCFVTITQFVELSRSAEGVAGAIAMPSIGVAMMVAVLRYRLFEIDRLVSRTLTYGVLTLLLVGIYLLGVSVLTAITAPVTRGSAVAVAAATLLAAAAFQPARRRIQTAVDRRFNRARYDARVTIEAFASSLRQEVDLDDVQSHLTSTVGSVLEPRQVTVWLRHGAVNP